MKIMKASTLFTFAFMVLIFTSCERAFMEPAPSTEPLDVFDEYANICIEKYGLASVYDVDLVKLADTLRTYVHNDMTDAELFAVMSVFIDSMQEGHTAIHNKDFSLAKNYAYYERYPLNTDYSVMLSKYYGPDANPNVQLLGEEGLIPIYYGYLPQDSTIGYISIQSFNYDISDAQLEQMMRYLSDAEGIIIDARSNLGGYVELCARFVGHFTNDPVFIATNYIKNGPGPDDFSANRMTLQPSGSPYTFTKPVMLLRDTYTFSSGSILSVMMDALPNATSIGMPYGGGTGEIMDGVLSNGWIWTLSTSNFVDSEGRPTDPGLDPDIFLLNDRQDTTQDDIIERAILELQ